MHIKRIITIHSSISHWASFLWYGRKHLYEAKGMKLIFGYNTSKPMRVKWDESREKWA